MKTLPPGIVIDKEINYGLPRLEQSSIGTHAIRDRFTAGEKVLDIASDYGIPLSEVERALRFEMSTDQAAAEIDRLKAEPKELIAAYMKSLSNAPRAAFVEWVEREHYRLAKIENNGGSLA